MTGGSRCSVNTCKSNCRNSKQEGQRLRFFSFPSNSLTRKEWIKRCKRTGKFDTKGKSICSLHFQTTDYEDGIKAQLLNYPPIKLKKDAVPKLNLPDFPQSSTIFLEKEKQYSVKLRKNIAKDCLEQYKVKIYSKNKRKGKSNKKKNVVESKASFVENEKSNGELVARALKSNCDCSSLEHCLKCQLQTLQEENEFLKKKIEVYKQKEIDFKCNEKKMQQTIDKMKNSPNRKDAVFEIKAKAAFKHFLTPNQVDMLLKKKSKVRWTEEEFTKAFNILQFSKQFYVYLKDTLNYPLPGFSTLKKWISDISLNIEKECPLEDTSHSKNVAPEHSSNSESEPSKISEIPNHVEQFSDNFSIPLNQPDHLQTSNDMLIRMNDYDIPSHDHSVNFDTQSLNKLLQSEIQSLEKPIESNNQHTLNRLMPSHIHQSGFSMHSENASFNHTQSSDHLSFSYVSTNNDAPRQVFSDVHADSLKVSLPEDEQSNQSLNLDDKQIKEFCTKVHFPPNPPINSKNVSSEKKICKTNRKPKERQSAGKTFQFHLSHKNFFNKLILNRIRRKTYKPMKPKRFICSTCNKGFDLSGALKRHFKTHVLENPWTCDVCDEVFSSKFYLDRHITTHKKSDRFLCDVCDQSFAKKINFKDHYLKHKNIQDCNSHSKTGDTTVSGKDHSINDSSSINSMPYLCHICNSVFALKIDLKNHLVVCKADKKNILKNAKDEKTIYVCETCRKEFKNKQYFQSHIQQHTNRKMFCCQICDKTFSAQHCLKRHMILHESTENKVQFTCDICSKTFSQKRYLTQHMQTHLSDKPYACCLCPKKFAQNSTLKKHAESHKNENYTNRNYLSETAIFQ